MLQCEINGYIAIKTFQTQCTGNKWKNKKSISSEAMLTLLTDDITTGTQVSLVL